MKEIGNADPFWDDLLLKIDDEITRLENLAQPDQTEFSILKGIIKFFTYFGFLD